MPEGSFSILERYGENYTEKEYVTNPAIGREEQLKALTLILLTPEKSAILIGEPGVGKTAIIEGMAYLIQRDEVPDALKGYTIINIKTASLLGTMPNGESKVQVMLDELKTREKVILFVDEIHMLIGATDESSLDFANIFKEGLGRGSIKVVGATTTAEYERYILRDKAFTRRFQRIDVPEPTREETIDIIIGTLPKIEKSTGVRFKYSKYQQRLIIESIVDITSEYKRVFEVNSRYPDIALTLFKSAFSFTVFDNRKEVNIFDFEKAIENTHLVYPDVIKKELPLFKEKFKDIYNEENGIVKEGIDLSKNNFNTTETEEVKSETNTMDTSMVDMSLLQGIDMNFGNATQVVNNVEPVVDNQMNLDNNIVQNVQPEPIVNSQVTSQEPVNQSVNTNYIDPSFLNNRTQTFTPPKRVDNSSVDHQILGGTIDLDLNSSPEQDVNYWDE